MLFAGDGVEAEIARDGLAIVREAAARQRARTQRHLVRAAAGFAEAFVIAREHFEIRQQIMRPQHRLRAPQMRVAGNDRVRIFFGQVEQRRHQAAQQFARLIALTPQPETRIERNLFIAAAAGVDFVREGAGLLLQLADDEGVDIFVSGTLEEIRRRALRGSVERRENLPAFIGCQNPGAGECARERLRTAHVGLDQTTVEVKRVGKSFEDFRRSSLKSPAPEFHDKTPEGNARGGTRMKDELFSAFIPATRSSPSGRSSALSAHAAGSRPGRTQSTASIRSPRR